MREMRRSAENKRLDRNLKDGLGFWEAHVEERKLKKELKERLKEISTKPQMVLWFIRRWAVLIFSGSCFVIAGILHLLIKQGIIF